MNLYVGNLDYGITDEDLREVFQEYGEVTAVKVIIDRETKRSKGFAFVEMANNDEGQKAINELNGALLEDRPLRVNEAREREERPRNFGGGGGGGFKQRDGRFNRDDRPKRFDRD
ncbi:MAG TPA: RNA-binding protein [Chitinophagales bacterium]|nr:RNA-binding protein [Chitinophagales bacterium]